MIYFGYAFKCHNCHQAIDKTKKYVVVRNPTRKGMVSKHYHPWCYTPKKNSVGVYLGLGDRKPEVKIGIG